MVDQTELRGYKGGCYPGGTSGRRRHFRRMDIYESGTLECELSRDTSVVQYNWDLLSNVP